MNDELNYLDKSNRKQVYWKDFNSINDIDVALLKTCLFEAAMLDKSSEKTLSVEQKNSLFVE